MLMNFYSLRNGTDRRRGNKSHLGHRVPRHPCNAWIIFTTISARTLSWGMSRIRWCGQDLFTTLHARHAPLISLVRELQGLLQCWVSSRKFSFAGGWHAYRRRTGQTLHGPCMHRPLHAPPTASVNHMKDLCTNEKFHLNYALLIYTSQTDSKLDKGLSLLLATYTHRPTLLA